MRTRFRDSTAVTSNVHVYTWDVDRLRDLEPRWGSLSRRAQQAVLSYVDPDTEAHTHNVTCVAMHERHALALEPDAEATGDASFLAFGDNNTLPETSNRALNNEVFRTPITNHDNNGDELRIRTFLDTGMANGENLLEVGLVSTDDANNENDQLWNHSLLDDPEGRLDPKTSGIVATIIAVLSWGDGT